MSSSRRRAFTLIELLVVIAIIAVLMVLLIPAVQKAKSAVWKIQCGNNLNQLAKGLNIYQSFVGFFPPAYKGKAPTSATSEQCLPGWGWGAWVLPYIDQKPLYDEMNVEGTEFGGGNNPASPTPDQQKVLRVMRCPANAAPELNAQRFNFATSNYRAVCGPTATHSQFSLNDDFKGIMYQNSRTRNKDIEDGASQRVILGECVLDLTVPDAKKKHGAIWAGMTGHVTNASTLPDPRAAYAIGARISDVMWWLDDVNTTGPGGVTYTINGTAPQAFGSYHGSGALFVFCDATVRFIPEDINQMQTLKWLAGRREGKTVSLP